MRDEINCIKRKCPMWEVDTWKCKVIGETLMSRNCAAFDYIRKKREELVCQIGSLSVQYNSLEGLEGYIMDHQEETN